MVQPPVNLPGIRPAALCGRDNAPEYGDESGADPQPVAPSMGLDRKGMPGLTGRGGSACGLGPRPKPEGNVGEVVRRQSKGTFMERQAEAGGSPWRRAAFSTLKKSRRGPIIDVRCAARRLLDTVCYDAAWLWYCLLYTSDAADDLLCVDL